MASRIGKHKEGKTLFGAYVSPEMKTIAEMANEKTGTSFTDMVLNGINHEAVKANLIINTNEGLQIAPKYKKDFALNLQMIKEKIKQRRRTK